MSCIAEECGADEINLVSIINWHSSKGTKQDQVDSKRQNNQTSSIAKECCADEINLVSIWNWHSSKGTKQDQLDSKKQNNQMSSIAEECGADEINLVSISAEKLIDLEVLYFANRRIGSRISLLASKFPPTGYVGGDAFIQEHY